MQETQGQLPIFDKDNQEKEVGKDFALSASVASEWSIMSELVIIYTMHHQR